MARLLFCVCFLPSNYLPLLKKRKDLFKSFGNHIVQLLFLHSSLLLFFYFILNRKDADLVCGGLVPPVELHNASLTYCNCL